MSKQQEEEGNPAGCLLILGFLIVGISVGNIWSAAVGWLVVGFGLMLAGILAAA